MTVYAYVDGPLGEMLLVGRLAAGGRAVLCSLSLPGQRGAVVVEDGWTCAPGAFEEVAGQLREYFAGERERFEVPRDDRAGTEFQRRVWRALEEVPYGSTVSYGEIARRVGAAGAGVRAVGTAIGRNPLLVVRPCHRVIGADGALRGYAAGVERKERLLGLEGALA
ncbi:MULTISPECIES: methylated-DNA--[protein]-cysteine S-methyltransferase [unclassified Streptomyces]|uniref:methylated-DNA--[protein]-cysteine S-methyltransferase n=1 Tax=unclassified Streptomyces TaxID=2593676 RepID=UPI0006AEB448|nr:MULTISPECIES: methylated-DNA--[protein]-cysteine S-methyltransferase [unclassified Streptomyces]KOX22902.1 cysteine methyltransferase [Streptomyces sp. NRRL F-6491]KOX40122.1 cysteine methyltransferase [Streptomyces sp. NRRL F-6492]